MSHTPSSKTLLSASLALLLSTTAFADSPTSQPTTIGFPKSVDPRETIPFLASDALAGRAPNTAGLNLAGDFLASELHALHLQPVPGKDDYFQSFVMPMSSTLGPSTNLLLNDKTLSLGTDFSPISMTGEGPFRGKLAFAGYCISRQDKDKPYDDFAGIDVHGKVVLAFRQEPRDADGKSKFAGEHQQWSSAAYFGNKAKAAADHGAVALLLVNRPASGGADMVTPFMGDPERAGSTIPVIQVSRRVADLLLSIGSHNSPPGTGRGTSPLTHDLAELQKAIDEKLQPISFDLPKVELAGDVKLRRTTAGVRNVIAYLPGAGPHADEYVIVGAHYDHLGTGQMGHMLGPTGTVYHGADDNASGTAAVLQLAERVSKSGPLPRSVVFAFFTAEEEGLIGSDYFVKHPPVPFDKVVAMLNLDMVGRSKDNTLLTGGVGTAPIFDSMVEQANTDSHFKLSTFERGGLGPSDHMSFALKNIPVLFLFTGLHADYHRPTDTADKINYAGIDQVVSMSERLLRAMTEMPRQIYDGSNDSKAAMFGATGQSMGRRAALGVVPDFNSVDGTVGVSISGVSQNTPAAAAGLKGGDLLVQFGSKQLNNLQDLSDALAEANPGDKINLKLKRDGKTIEVPVTLGERKE